MRSNGGLQGPVRHARTSDEPFIYHGEELTDEHAEELADETLAELRKRSLRHGRKSLRGEGKHSPKIEFRVPATLRAELDYDGDR